MRRLTRAQAYKIVEQKAKSLGLSVSAYAEKRNVNKGTVSRWRTSKEGTVKLDTLYRLGIKL